MQYPTVTAMNTVSLWTVYRCLWVDPASIYRTACLLSQPQHCTTLQQITNTPEHAPCKLPRAFGAAQLLFSVTLQRIFGQCLNYASQPDG